MPPPAADRASGQHPGDGPAEVVFEHAPQPLAVLGPLQPRVARVQVHGELPFPMQVVEGVFVGRQEVVGAGPLSRSPIARISRSASAGP